MASRMLAYLGGGRVAGASDGADGDGGSGCGAGGLVGAAARGAVGFEDEPFRRHVADRSARCDLVRVRVRIRVRVRARAGVGVNDRARARVRARVQVSQECRGDPESRGHMGASP